MKIIRDKTNKIIAITTKNREFRDVDVSKFLNTTKTKEEILADVDNQRKNPIAKEIIEEEVEDPKIIKKEPEVIE